MYEKGKNYETSFGKATENGKGQKKKEKILKNKN